MFAMSVVVKSSTQWLTPSWPSLWASRHHSVRAAAPSRCLAWLLIAPWAGFIVQIFWGTVPRGCGHTIVLYHGEFKRNTLSSVIWLGSAHQLQGLGIRLTQRMSADNPFLTTARFKLPKELWTCPGGSGNEGQLLPVGLLCIQRACEMGSDTMNLMF